MATTATLLALQALSGLQPCGTDMWCYRMDQSPRLMDKAALYPYLTVTVNCSRSTLETIVPVNYYIETNEIFIIDCPLPVISYANALTRLNFKVVNITRMYIYKSLPFRSKDFQGLSLQSLRIGPTDPITWSTTGDNFLEPLQELKVLHLSQMELSSPMPQTSKLEEVTLTFAKIYGSWGGCDELKKLTLNRTYVSNTGLLGACPRLQELVLINMKEDCVLQVLSGLQTLLAVTIKDSRLSEVPPHLFRNVALRRLTLNANGLTSVSDLRRFTCLEELDVSDNPLTSVDGLTKTLIPLRKLSSFRLNNDHLDTDCGEPKLSITGQSMSPDHETGDVVVYTCSAQLENTGCHRSINILQWHHLRYISTYDIIRTEEPTYDTWKAAGSDSVTLNMTLQKHHNYTVLLCKGVFQDRLVFAKFIILLNI